MIVRNENLALHYNKGAIMWEELHDLEVLAGDPVQKWSEIILHASPTLAKKELDRILELLATYEVAFEESGADMRKFIHTHQEQITAQKRNIAIESSANILSENE